MGVRALQLRPALPRGARSTASPRTSSGGSSNPFNPQAYRAQLFAAALHNCYGRLDRIRVPTLVVHGAHDRMIPVENAHLMAERLPNCRLTVLEDSGHLYPTEAPEIDEAIAGFFADAAERAPARRCTARLIELTSVQVRRAPGRGRHPRAGRGASGRRRDPPRRPRASPTRELDERSNRLAQALLRRRRGPGSRIAHLDRTRARGGRAARRGEQDRRGHRAAELAAGGAGADGDRRPTPARRC